MVSFSLLDVKHPQICAVNTIQLVNCSLKLAFYSFSLLYLSQNWIFTFWPTWPRKQGQTGGKAVSYCIASLLTVAQSVSDPQR